MIRRQIRTRLTLLIIPLATLLAGRPAHASDAKCPYCKLAVLDDSGEMDNRVTLTQGARRIEYRCVFCAIAKAKSEIKGNLTIIAPSEVKGRPVIIHRKDGIWSSAPANAVFVAEKGNHRVCQLTYRAFTSPASLAAHVRKNQRLFKGARPVNLPAMVELSR